MNRWTNEWSKTKQLLISKTDNEQLNLSTGLTMTDWHNSLGESGTSWPTCNFTEWETDTGSLSKCLVAKILCKLANTLISVYYLRTQDFTIKECISCHKH